jgi:hypothetical protein
VKNIMIALSLTLSVPLMAQASTVCGSLPDAEQAVASALDLASSASKAVAVQGEEEYLSGGRYVYRKILVKTGPKINKSVVVSYSIVKSFDGPDNGDYCNLTAIEETSVVCERNPNLQLCQ